MNHITHKGSGEKKPESAIIISIFKIFSIRMLFLMFYSFVNLNSRGGQFFTFKYPWQLKIFLRSHEIIKNVTDLVLRVALEFQAREWTL